VKAFRDTFWFLLGEDPLQERLHQRWERFEAVYFVFSPSRLRKSKRSSLNIRRRQQQIIEQSLVSLA
jgi:hypothetical protein